MSEKPRKVYLREKKLKSGRLSLYLDIYPPVFDPETGKESRREFLHIHIFEKPSNPTEKEINRVGRTKAESIRAERELQYLNQQFDLTGRLNGKRDFLEYFLRKTEEKYKSQGNYGNWLSAYNHLLIYTNKKCQFSDVTEAFCEGFKQYLQMAKSFRDQSAPLSVNSQVSYFAKLKAALKEATKEKLFTVDPARNVKGITPEETEREFLTFEELQLLYQTECSYPLLKRAAIFSALTGLRWSDIEKLTWAEVQHSESDGYFIRFRQKKTKGAETLPIADQAFEQLGERANPEQRIFKGLTYSANNNMKLSRWVLDSGITKDITFHCFRHTYATLQLQFGTDIYTVSKMLGHKNLRTTEVYAKIVDQKKKETVNRIKL